MRNDTICALATPAGGAIGIIRISGDCAISIADSIFMTKNRKSLREAKGNTLHYGEIHDGQATLLDEVVVSVYRAPHSYTGEDCIEISCHGSQYILQMVLQALIDAGCKQAQPGEFTKRAYLNGKMDLSQAEAVADLIGSSNKASHKLALSQLKGHFSSELAILREQLLKLTSLLELELDFSDHEELEFADRGALTTLAQKIKNRISTLAHSFETGNALKNGIPVAIVGKTNVGKSTLLNRLLHEEKAIVSDIHGTTRDVIEDTTTIRGITFRFIDTAGIRKTQDTIEQLGIERAYKKMEAAAIVLWVVDIPPSNEDIKEMEERTLGKQVILVHNKIDKAPHDGNAALSSSIANEAFATEAFISAKSGQGIRALEDAIYANAHVPEIDEDSIIVTNVRHYEALTHANESISRVLQSMEIGLSGDLISEDLRICLEQLADITGGQITTNEVLGNIFQHFCIGK
ncbi:tRNA modification GTPase TrmE [Segatella baroniae F0067]|uniref:tRNA modification GTPase MnmE n=1 Tax=Segatella baroniae F0067 TaxID=1115809 RepID=U2QB44_9BACT|nr:tRNA uridine-5-carboxymethylaminomethyl(34) synthesis GTPase MnmE [Segatella baroniae]ERK38523.1 tRNA modification GTPase TrmE [Segatella baroniae F0067]